MYAYVFLAESLSYSGKHHMVSGFGDFSGLGLGLLVNWILSGKVSIERQSLASAQSADICLPFWTCESSSSSRRSEHWAGVDQDGDAGQDHGGTRVGKLREVYVPHRLPHRNCTRSRRRAHWIDGCRKRAPTRLPALFYQHLAFSCR